MRTKKSSFTKALFAVALATSLILLSMSFTERQYTCKELKGIPFIDKGTIKGKVYIEGRKTSIGFATVELFIDTRRMSGTTSATDGSFILANVPVGIYSIKVAKSGYDTYYSKKIKVEADKTTIINIGLKAVVKEVKKEIEIVEDAEEIQEVVLLDHSLQVIPASKDMKRSYSQSATALGKGAYKADGTNYIPHNTESYDKINENIFKEVVNNPLSTFSIDVDRAAYSNVRRFLNMNQMPYKDAVRIEEMINYFDYDYPQPDNGDPFSVNLEMGNCPWNKKHKLMMIGIQGEEITTESIPAGNIVFLIDVSGSMGSANKLPLLKQAFKILVNNLRSEDKVAIVVYAGAAGCVLESTSGKDKNKIIAALDRLHSGGSTAGGAGIKLAYKIAKENYIPGGNNRVILATDGDFNIGASSDGEMTRLIEEKRKDGVFLSILGFGMGNYKDSKMEQISNAGNGNYAYIDNILEAKKVFGKELWGTLYTIAKDVKIQIEFNPAKVKAYRLIGYENRILNKEDFNDDKKDAGDIGSGHTVTAIYELVLAGSDEKLSDVDPLEYQKANVVSSSNLMTLKLRYKDPEESTSKLIVRRVNAKEMREDNASDNFNFAVAVAEFGMLLRDSEHKKNSSYKHTLALAKQAKGKDEFGYRNEFIKLVETAELLSK